MEVSYALAPSGDPPPCKRVLTRALEDWDIVTAEAVLEGKECHPVGTVRSLQPMSVVILWAAFRMVSQSNKIFFAFLNSQSQSIEHG